MIAKLLRLQLMSCLALIAICAGANGCALCATRLSEDECREAPSSMTTLRSADQRERERAKKSILDFARRSSISRQCVIKKTLKIVTEVSIDRDKGAKSFWNSPGRFQEWSDATDILGTLRAMEALDVLIDCLDCNDGRFGLSIGPFPATRAVVKFGDQATQKLEAALQQKPPGIRVMAVQALHAIGGEKAKSILLEALKRETNKSVIDTIRNMLLSWNTSSPQ
jgi:hypothetical protein